MAKKIILENFDDSYTPDYEIVAFKQAADCFNKCLKDLMNELGDKGYVKLMTDDISGEVLDIEICLRYTR